MLAAVLVTSAVALLDACTGARPVQLGLLIAGPLLAAATLHLLLTALAAQRGPWCWAWPPPTRPSWQPPPVRWW
jgi:hypothetical protein